VRIARPWLAAAGILAVTCSLSASAEAAPPWVERHVVQPKGDWAFDFGLGVGHAGRPDLTGPGINAEGSVAVTNGLELGLRTGIRMGNEARVTGADGYGRLFDRQTFGVGGDVLANPEFRVRGALVRDRVVELALEGRIVLPIEQGTRAGIQMGMPLWFHLGNRVRLDTGLFVPVVFTTPTFSAFSAPLDVWIQVSPQVWLGPETGFVYYNQSNTVNVPLGFGFGYQFTHALDLKAQLLFPAVNHDDGARNFGAGVGVQVRID
jgi:hypothetical protein